MRWIINETNDENSNLITGNKTGDVNSDVKDTNGNTDVKIGGVNGMTIS